MDLERKMQSEKNIKTNVPSPEDIRREVQDFLNKRYGSSVVMSQVEILGQKESSTHPRDDEQEIHFDMTPEELESYLKQYVVHQDEAIEILATKIATHFHRIKWENHYGDSLPAIPGQIKPNILMIGPTGVGKTYMIKLIADRIGVPFVKGDATKFSETGYVGGDVEDLVRDLVKAAGGNIKTAENGIIYIDEIDKIAASQGLVGPDVSRTGVQRNLLKLMEETEVELRVPHDLASQMEAVIETQRSGKAPQKRINTRNILFIVSGAFNGLEKMVKRRLNRQPIGFGGDIQKGSDKLDDILDQVSTQDLIEYGFESEFIGRLPVLVRLHELDVEGLYEVLTNPYNAVVQGKIRDFAAYGIELSIHDEILRKAAQLAHKEGTGARGLARVVERMLIHFEKRLPSSNIKKFNLTLEREKNPRTACDELILRYSLEDAVEQFKKKTGVTLNISPAAIHWLQEQALSEITPGKLLLQRLEGYEYGISFLGKDNLQVTVNLLKNPKDYLESLIKKSYRDNDLKR